MLNFVFLMSFCISSLINECASLIPTSKTVEKSLSSMISFVAVFVIFIGISNLTVMSDASIVTDVFALPIVISSPWLLKMSGFAQLFMLLSIKASNCVWIEFGPSEELRGGMLLMPKNPSNISAFDAAVLYGNVVHG